MGWKCDLFGHKLPKGYGRGTPYLKIELGIIDGIGRKHGTIRAKCDREECGKTFDVCNVHIPRLDEYGELIKKENGVLQGFKDKWGPPE